MVSLDLKCQVNIVASKIQAISKSKPPCFFLIWYSLIELIFKSKTSVFNPKLCISLKYFMCTSITGNSNADFLTRSTRLWGVYAAPAMSCKVARRSKKIALRLPTEQWGFLKTDRVSSDQDFKIAYLSTVFQTFNVFILLSWPRTLQAHWASICIHKQCSINGSLYVWFQMLAIQKNNKVDRSLITLVVLYLFT